MGRKNKKAGEVKLLRLFIERLAATYSRRTYRTTTIGPAVFDGRVRNGNGSDHCGIATKKRKSEYLSNIPTKYKKNVSEIGSSMKSAHRRVKIEITIRESKILVQFP